MKTRKQTPIEITEDDIRAYAAHLYEQSGRVPGRDLENWLEAETCLRACVTTAATLAGYRDHVARHGTAGGFTMPASDASLEVEKVGCVGTTQPKRHDKRAHAAAK